MAEETSATATTTAADADALRVYEVGYHVIPTVQEEDLDKVVGALRSRIEQGGGSFIAEGAPAATKLAYPMEVQEGDKAAEYDRSYFGWIKFESAPSLAKELEEMLRTDARFIRAIVFCTVREDTRAKMKPLSLREVKRTDTLTSRPRRTEEVSAPVSEAELEKALKDITAE